MNAIDASRVEQFAVATLNFCSWATSPVTEGEDEAVLAAQYLSALFAAGCALDWKEGESADQKAPTHEIEAVRLKAMALPIRYYSEIFNNLVIPPEQPVVGDIVDDLVDIYGDIAPGLALFQEGERAAALDHWQFWFPYHWGEHATSALRTLWSYLSRCEGSARP
jgi:hypothetical protein